MSSSQKSASPLADSIARAVDLGLPRDLAVAAEGATLRRARSSCEHWGNARLHAYYWGVVRRTAMRGGARTKALRDRYLRASVTQDARRAGAERAVEAA